MRCGAKKRESQLSGWSIWPVWQQIVLPEAMLKLGHHRFKAEPILSSDGLVLTPRLVNIGVVLSLSIDLFTFWRLFPFCVEHQYFYYALNHCPR